MNLGYVLYDKTEENWLIQIGNITLYKENKKQWCCCVILNDIKKIEYLKEMCGKVWSKDKKRTKSDCFTAKRIRVIQMNKIAIK